MASAQRQSVREVEILIGDDGNRPDLREWAEATASADARVRYIKSPTRLGLAGNWFMLARAARGAFVNIIGDDDRLLPEFAARLTRAASDETDVVFCNHHVIDAQGRRLPRETAAFAESYGRNDLSPGPVDAASCVWRNSVPMLASLARTETVQRLGFKTDINTPELELFARMAAEHREFVFVPDYLAEYRSHGESLTSGGLTVDRLVAYLEPVVVEARIEPLKCALLREFASAGVHRLMLEGRIADARELMRSKYYNRDVRDVRNLAQRALLSLPEAYVEQTYARFVSAVRNAKRVTRKVVE